MEKGKIYKMKIFLLLILVFFPVAIEATGSQSLSVPEIIEFGECPIGTSIYPAVFMREFRLTNNSDKAIYLSHISIDLKYPNYIASRGNYLNIFDRVFKYGTAERILIPGDTASFSLWYRSMFADTVSKKGYLQAELVFTYHYKEDATEFYDTSKVQMRSLDKDTLFTTGNYYVTWDYCEYKFGKTPWDLFLTIYNKTKSSYIIDSISYSKQGEFNYMGLNDVKPSDNIHFRELPYEMVENSVVYLVTDIMYSGFSYNIINFNIYCRNKDNNEPIILKDSLILNITKPQPAILVNGSSYLVAYLGDTIVHKEDLKVNLCGGDSLVVDSVIVVGDIGLNKYTVFPFAGEFPRWLNSDSTGLSKIGSIEFIANEEGQRNGNVIAYFHDRSSNNYIRYAPFQIYVLPPVTSVSDFTSVDDENIVYPNPCSEFINVYFKNFEQTFESSLVIFNSIGKKVSDSKIENSITKIETNNFANGLYFIVIKNNNEFKTSNFIVQKE